MDSEDEDAILALPPPPCSLLPPKTPHTKRRAPPPPAPSTPLPPLPGSQGFGTSDRLVPDCGEESLGKCLDTGSCPCSRAHQAKLGLTLVALLLGGGLLGLLLWLAGGWRAGGHWGEGGLLLLGGNDGGANVSLELVTSRSYLK